MMHDLLGTSAGLILTALLFIALKGFWAAYINILKENKDDSH